MKATLEVHRAYFYVQHPMHFSWCWGASFNNSSKPVSTATNRAAAIADGVDFVSSLVLPGNSAVQHSDAGLRFFFVTPLGMISNEARKVEGWVAGIHQELELELIACNLHDQQS